MKVDCEKLLAMEIETTDFYDSPVTLRVYLARLLSTVWEEGEDFSGKRAFGNSAWQFDVYRAMIKNEFVTGKLDEFDDIETVDIQECDRLVYECIKHVMGCEA